MRVLVAVMLSSTIAAASPAAEQLFQDAKALLAAGKTAEACDAFRKSQALEPRAGTLLNLGACEEKRGRIATAWDAFVQARTMATNPGEDPRKAKEADKRIAAIAKRLPYMTIRVKQPAVTVTRNGEPVPAAELDHELPIDPGDYQLEATAAGHVAWKQTATVALGQKLVIDVPVLAASPEDPVTVAPPLTEVATAKPTAPEPAPIAVEARSSMKLRGNHRLGIGVAIGGSTDDDVIYGARIPVQLARVGPGLIRALASVFYTKFEDPADVYHHIKLYAVGLGVEYVQPLAPTFFIAAGAGIGQDYLDDNYGSEITNQTWGALRLSPTLRLGKWFDIGLHLQAVKTKDRTVGLYELGVDYFFY